ncbi:MAG: PspC domain-containing protein, partial [Acidimicrobiales bacterium]
MADTSHAPPPQPDVWSPPPVRGYRSVDNRYVAGVLGGLGERLGVDPLFLRIGVVVAAVLTRSAAPLLVPLAYGVAWLVIPPWGGRSLIASLGERRGWQATAGVLMLVVATWIVLGVPSLWLAGGLAFLAWLLLAPESPGATAGADGAGREADGEAAGRADG